MNKILLTAAFVLLAAAPALSITPPHVGMGERLRTIWHITQAKPRLQKLAITEIDVHSAEALRRLKIVMPSLSVDSSDYYDQTYQPLTQARLLLYEQETLLAALAKNYRLVKDLLKKITSLTTKGDMMTKYSRADGLEEQHIFNESNLDQAANLYIDTVLDLTEGLAVVIDTREDPIYLTGFARRIYEEFGVEMGYVRERIASREKAGHKDLARVLRELGKWHNIPFTMTFSTALAKQRGFSVEIEAGADPMVDHPDWPMMSLPGVEVKAKLYEIASRIAASYHDYESLSANLLSIIDLNNTTDGVYLTVNFEGIEATLNEHTYDTVEKFYHQAFIK